MKTGREKYQAVYPKSGGLCYICGLSIEEDYQRLMEWYDIKEKKPVGEKMPFRRKSIPLNFDHIIPKSLDKRPGSPLRSLDNLAIVHKACNSKKANTVLL